MTDAEAADILFGIAVAKRERAADLRDAQTYSARERARILSEQADALDYAIERIGGIVN